MKRVHIRPRRPRTNVSMENPVQAGGRSPACSSDTALGLISGRLPGHQGGASGPSMPSLAGLMPEPTSQAGGQHSGREAWGSLPPLPRALSCQLGGPACQGLSPHPPWLGPGQRHTA